VASNLKTGPKLFGIGGSTLSMPSVQSGERPHIEEKNNSGVVSCSETVVFGATAKWWAMILLKWLLLLGGSGLLLRIAASKFFAIQGNGPNRRLFLLYFFFFFAAKLRFLPFAGLSRTIGMAFGNVNQLGFFLQKCYAAVAKRG